MVTLIRCKTACLGETKVYIKQTKIADLITPLSPLASPFLNVYSFIIRVLINFTNPRQNVNN